MNLLGFYVFHAHSSSHHLQQVEWNTEFGINITHSKHVNQKSNVIIEV